MTIIQAIILGLVQGLTEFLPVSSSGHLVLVKALMGIQTGNDITFEVVLHFGTLISVVIVFWNDLLAFFHTLIKILRAPSQIGVYYREDGIFRLLLFVIIGCIPAGIIGVMFNDFFEEVFQSPKLVSSMLLVTGAILFLTRFAKRRENGEINFGASCAIGCAQAVAILPGVSRAGSTISAGLFFGVAQETAARFSFLMAMPVIFGATILKVRHLVEVPPSSDELMLLCVGCIVACITGYVALRFLFVVLKKGKFSYFSYYCFIVGIIGLLFIS